MVHMDTNPKVARKEAKTATKNGEAAAAKKEVIKQWIISDHVNKKKIIFAKTVIKHP